MYHTPDRKDEEILAKPARLSKDEIRTQLELARQDYNTPHKVELVSFSAASLMEAILDDDLNENEINLLKNCVEESIIGDQIGVLARMILIENEEGYSKFDRPSNAYKYSDKFKITPFVDYFATEEDFEIFLAEQEWE
jgi:hypothetical protein